jgi:membrane fusion protein (multidrug efflux system)
MLRAGLACPVVGVAREKLHAIKKDRPTMMNKTLTILSMAMLLASCQGSNQEASEEMPALEVTLPLRKDVTLTKEYVSQIHAFRHIELKALEKGYLQDTFVDEGQVVEQGQPMFKIMPSVYQAEFEKAKAEANAARIEYQNTKSLADKNIVSPNELAVTKATLDKAEAEVNLASAHLNFTDVDAPFSGMMDHLEVRKGSMVDEGELLTTLADISKMWVYFNVPEAEYLGYKLNGMTSEVVKLKLANGMVFDQVGKIEAIEADFDNTTGNIEFRATFPNPKQILRHGQTGNILMDLPYPNALLVPQKATFEVLDKTFVYVVDAENKLEQREIAIAAELPHVFIVSDGLQDSDKVLIDGLRRVQNGQEITPDFKDPAAVYEELDLYAE